MAIGAALAGGGLVDSVDPGAVSAATKSRTYRLPIDLWERIRALQEQRLNEARERLPAHLRDTVRVQETDVVIELLRRGLEAAEAEAKPKRRR